MTLTAFEPLDIAQIDRVLERPALSRDPGVSFCLIENRVTDIAVLPDNLAGRAYVLPVMAAEAPLRIEVAYVIRMSLPIRLHLRERVCSVDSLDFGNSLLDRITLAGMHVRISQAVELVEARSDVAYCFVGRGVRL
jgi:hypothetical protein